ncbi:MAG: XdhC family protein [Chloroflexota bacterium]|nr:XdhC family protein [Chloroflexota bacterium]
MLASIVRSRLDVYPAGRKWLVLEGESIPAPDDDPLDRAVHRDLTEALAAAEPVCHPYTREGERPRRRREAVVEVFFEPLRPPDRLVIVGAGHVAVPICQIGQASGFEITVIDDRSDYANRERFPQAEQILVGDMAECLAGLSVDASTYIVLVTRAHAFDERALQQLVGCAAPYIGMIGSRRRVLIVYRNLVESGIPVERLGNIYAPIGLDIGSRTPEEIGLAVVAEIVNVKRGGPAPSLRLEHWQRFVRGSAGIDSGTG